MKIYISLPITGHKIERCKARADSVKDMIRRRGHDAITPFDVCPETNLTYARYMGKDIEALLESDAIFLCSGWSESRGCSLEWRCAEIYNKPIFRHINELKTISK